MQMTLEQAEAHLLRLQAEHLKMQGYVQALREMEADKEGADCSASPPTKLKAVGT
jgi:hypothetical protein